MPDATKDQAQNELEVIIHDSDLLDILTSFPDQINGMQALLKRLRIMLRMSKGNINHWHWAKQSTWVEWCGFKNKSPFIRLDAEWLEQGWFEKTERPGKTSYVKFGKVFDVYRTQPQNVVNTQPQNVVNTQPQNVVNTQPQNVVNTQPQNVVNTQPQNVVTKSQYLKSQKLKSHKSSVCEERKPTHTGWVSHYSPETIINRLADLGCIKTSGKGFIENVTFWNKEARDSLGALETDDLTEFIIFTKKSLGSGKLKPTEGSLANMLTAWHSREKEAINEEPQYFEENDYFKVKDDCPY